MEKLGVTKHEQLKGLLKQESSLMNEIAHLRGAVEQGEKTASERADSLNNELMAVRQSIRELE